MEFVIGDMFTLRGIIAFPDNGRFVAALGEVAVKAVSRQI